MKTFCFVPYQRLQSLQCSQRGQALVFGLAILFVGSLALFFLFSTGQVSANKQKLTNAADAAAYSAAVWRARVMNFHAYSNRAIIAQEVAVAQAVTLASWSQYFANYTQNIGSITTIYPPAAGLSYAAAPAQVAASLAQQAMQLEIVARAAKDIGYKELLQTSQEVLQLTTNIFGLSSVAFEVAKANNSTYFAFALPDGDVFNSMTKRYASDPERERLKSLVIDSLDPFVKGRDVNLNTLAATVTCIPSSLSQLSQRLIKRGGTTLGDGLERWEAADTQSLHYWRAKGFFAIFCNREPELAALGWGAGEAQEGTPLGGLIHNPGNVNENAGAAFFAATSMQSNSDYAGIGRVRELDYDQLSNTRFPVSSIAVLARQEQADLRTANQLQVGTGRLRLTENLPAARTFALAASEIYFSSPEAASGNIEYASLYSPYWQARLAAPTASQRSVAETYVR